MSWLHPAYFAVVMSTGIVSIAFWNLGFPSVFWALYYINIVTYIVLLVLWLVRFLRHLRSIGEDLMHPGKGWGFMTFVAGTNVFGVQTLIAGSTLAPQILWIVGIVTWAAIMYPVYINLIGRLEGPIETVISGASLLTTVSTQSVAVLGSQSAHLFGGAAPTIMLVSWLFWAAGFMLYLVVIILVAYRLLARKVEPADWNGTYWICMGAVAITTVAGSALVQNMSAHPQLGDLVDPTLVVTFLAWAIGTWWIPILIVMDIRKLAFEGLERSKPWWVRVFPWLRLGLGSRANHYITPLSWGRVFPMGMYTAATLGIAAASGIQELVVIPRYWGWLALLIWALSVTGTLRVAVRGVAACSDALRRLK